MRTPPPQAEPHLDRLRRMARARRGALKDEHPEIIEALLRGATQAQVARAIDRSREHVRQVYNQWLEEQEQSEHAPAS